MKKYLKVLVALLCVVACILSLASCGDSCPHTNTVAVDEANAKDPVGIEPGMTAGKQCADCGAIVEAPHEFYRVSFIYSRKAEITDASGTKIKNVETEVFCFDFAKDNNNGFTAESEAAAKAMAYHGYTFIGWHTSWNQSTQEPAGTAYSFPKERINANSKVYVERGDKVGENVTWKLESAGSGKYELVISGNGPMFDFEFCDGIDIPWYIDRAKIVKLTVEDGVTTIGNNAFASLTALAELDLADSITSIGVNAFLGDKKLKVVTMPAGVTVIKENAFKGCTGLKNVVLNEGLKTIEQLAFYGDKAIVSVVVPTSLETVGNSAFHPGTNENTGAVESHSLAKVFFLGATEAEFDAIDVSMENMWFADFATVYCYTTDAAKGITGSYWYLDGGVPVQYTVSISYKVSGYPEAFAVDYVPVTPVKSGNLVVTDANGNVKDYVGTVTAANIAFRAALSYHGYKFASFSDGTLAEGAEFNKDRSVTCNRGNLLSNNGGILWEATDTDGDGAKDTVKVSPNPNGTFTADDMKTWDFAHTNDSTVYAGGSLDAMKKITTLIIEDGVTYIGKNIFAGFLSITEVYIPATVTEVHPEAFSGCTNLTALYYRGTSLDACENITELVNVSSALMPFASTDAAVATEGSYWMNVSGKTLAWKIADGTLTIAGDSDMVDFAAASDAPWYGAKANITSVVIAKKVVNLGENIVNGYTGVTSIKLHNNIKEIPATAFAGTGILNNTAAYVDGALIVDGVLLKVDASSAANAELYKISKSVTNIAGGAFDGCNNIEKLYVTKGVFYITAGTFADLELDVVYFETKAGMDKFVANGTFNATAEKYFYSATPDPEAFHYDNSGNFVLWKNG